MRIQSFLFALIVSVVAAQAQTPTVAAGGVLNGASFVKGQAVTPGSLVSIFGTGLATNLTSASTIPLSDSLGSVSVNFVNGSTTIPAPMLFVAPDTASSGSQLNVQVPWDIVPAGTSATVNVIVTNNGVASPPQAVSIAPFSPGIFTSNNLAIAQNSTDFELAQPSGSIPGLTTHPAKPGDVLIIYATGLGAVDSPPGDGNNSLDKLRTNVTPPQVMIGGIQAVVQFAGLTPQFVGVNQINVQVPPNVPFGDKIPLQIVLGGVTTPDNVTIAVAQQ